MEEYKQFASIQLFEFMAAIDDYNMYNHKRLIKYGNQICWSYAMADPDTVIDIYKKFTKYISRHDLYGCTDLEEPINKIHKKAKAI